MKENVHRTAQLGDVIVAAFDEAARYSTDPRLVSQLATSAVLQMLRHAPGTSTPRFTAKGMN